MSAYELAQIQSDDTDEYAKSPWSRTFAQHKIRPGRGAESCAAPDYEQ